MQILIVDLCCVHLFEWMGAVPLQNRGRNGAASAGGEEGDVIGGEAMMPGNELLAETAGQKTACRRHSCA